MKRSKIIKAVEDELERIYKKYGDKPYASRHEFYGILKEEVDEVWDDIKHNSDTFSLEKEIIQVISICFRHLEKSH